jgi:hypothetical protein
VTFFFCVFLAAPVGTPADRGTLFAASCWAEIDAFLFGAPEGAPLPSEDVRPVGGDVKVCLLFPISQAYITCDGSCLMIVTPHFESKDWVLLVCFY